MLEREPVDALHHVNVAPLTQVERLGVVAFRLEMSAMDDHVHVREQGLQRGVIVESRSKVSTPSTVLPEGSTSLTSMSLRS